MSQFEIHCTKQELIDNWSHIAYQYRQISKTTKGHRKLELLYEASGLERAVTDLKSWKETTSPDQALTVPSHPS